jgi:hypothetical protein
VQEETLRACFEDQCILFVYASARACFYMNVLGNIYIYIYMYIYIYICMYIYIYIYIYILGGDAAWGFFDAENFYVHVCMWLHVYFFVHVMQHTKCIHTNAHTYT